LKISIKHYNILVEVEIPEDSSYDEVLEVFFGMLVVTGFSDKMRENYIRESASIYEHEENSKREQEENNELDKDLLSFRDSDNKREDLDYLPF